MISATIGELVVCKDVLEHLNNSPMPAKTAFRFSEIIRNLNQRLADFERDVATKRADFTPDREKELDVDEQRDFEEFVEEQLGRSVEIEGQPFEVSELGPMVVLAPAQTALLYWLIYEERNG